MRKLISVAFSSLVLAACVSGPTLVRYEPMVATNLPSKSASQVEVFHTQKPTRPYKEIGVLTYRAGTAETLPEVSSYLQIKAAEIGADGVIMMGTSAGPGMRVGTTSMMATLTDYSAMAIKYAD